ncbi:hypothetical protein ACQ4PT_045787 [Festuca glaucescens]
MSAATPADTTTVTYIRTRDERRDDGRRVNCDVHRRDERRDDGRRVDREGRRRGDRTRGSATISGGRCLDSRRFQCLSCGAMIPKRGVRREPSPELGCRGRHGASSRQCRGRSPRRSPVLRLAWRAVTADQNNAWPPTPDSAGLRAGAASPASTLVGALMEATHVSDRASTPTVSKASTRSEALAWQPAGFSLLLANEEAPRLLRRGYDIQMAMRSVADALELEATSLTVQPSTPCAPVRSPEPITPPWVPAPSLTSIATTEPSLGRSPLFVPRAAPILSSPSPRPIPPTTRRKTLAPGCTITRSSARLKLHTRTMPIAVIAEKVLCRRLGIVAEGEELTKQAIKKSTDMF